MTVPRVLVVSIKVVIGVIIPITKTAVLCGAESAIITSQLVMLEELLLWSSSLSSKASALKVRSASKASSTIASATEAPSSKAPTGVSSAHVVAAEAVFMIAITEPSSKGSVERSTAGADPLSFVLRVVWTIFPKVSPFMGPTGLVALSIFSLLLDVLKLLEFSLASFFVAFLLVC